ncbi:MAG: TIGR03936 family radical SAM-associated protein [Anaerolineae bacterium]|nr:TIGR03936 family radical SAM-associated protein [Anaerolineae bacterium]
MSRRFRIKYAKQADLKYTSGLEVQKIWERSLRRGHLPVAYSQGFHPQARINQSAPLPLGFTSSAEWIDIWFQDECDLNLLQNTLPAVIPSGFKLLEIEEIPLSAPTMQSKIVSASYRVLLLDANDAADLLNRIETLLAAPQIMRIRREKEYDLRALIEDLRLGTPVDGLQAIEMRLAARPGATGRPEEVLLAMELDPMATRIEKTDMVFDFGA